jgi:hypothetical protein
MWINWTSGFLFSAAQSIVLTACPLQRFCALHNPVLLTAPPPLQALRTTPRRTSACRSRRWCWTQCSRSFQKTRGVGARSRAPRGSLCPRVRGSQRCGSGGMPRAQRCVSRRGCTCCVALSPPATPTAPPPRRCQTCRFLFARCSVLRGGPPRSSAQTFWKLPDCGRSTSCTRCAVCATAPARLTACGAFPDARNRPQERAFCARASLQSRQPRAAGAGCHMQQGRLHTSHACMI